MTLPSLSSWHCRQSIRMPRKARAVRPASRTRSGWLSMFGLAVAVMKFVAGLPVQMPLSAISWRTISSYGVFWPRADRASHSAKRRRR